MRWMRKRLKRLLTMPKARIIAGTHRRLQFETGDLPQTRPVKDRVKESLFNQLEPFHYERVLDAFAGAGSLSFEAISRGAKWVDAVEQDRAAFQLLTRNINALKMPIKAIRMDVFEFVETDQDPYDLILLDPPYKAALLEPFLKALKKHGKLTPHTRLICLHETPFDAPDFEVLSSRKLGRTSITHLKELR